MELDFFTIMISIGIVSTLVAIAIFYYILVSHKNQWHINLFLLAKILQIIAAVLLGLRGEVSNIISIQIANLVVFLSIIFEIIAVTSFDKKANKVFIYVYIVFFILFSAIFLYVSENELLRTKIVAISLGLVAFAGAIFLLFKRGHYKVPIMISTAYILYTVTQIVRLLLLGHQDELYKFTNLHFFDTLTILSSLGILVLVSFGFILALKEVDDKKLFEMINLRKAAIDQSPAPIIITNTNAQIVYVNPIYEKVTGYKLDELLGAKPSVLNSGKTPPETFVKLWKTILGGKSWSGEFINRKKDGSLYYENAVIAPIKNEKGETQNYIAIKKDITEQRLTEIALNRSEERLRTIFNSTFTGVALFDATGSFVYSNKAAETIHGYSFEQLEMNNYTKVVHADDHEFANKLFAQIISGQQPFANEEMRLVHEKTKKVIWINLNVAEYPKLDTDTTERVIAVFQDITKLKENESKLNELNATKDKFFKIIAHDLKNPFNTILGLSEVLNEDYSTLNETERKKYIETIFTSSKITSDLLSNLLNWSRTNTGSIQFKPEVISIDYLFDSVMSLYEGQASEKEIQLKKKLTESYTVNIDKYMIDTVLRNLVGNAIKFTARKGVVTMAAHVGDDDYLQISVNDTGVGMSSEKIHDLFSIDKNVTTTGTENEQGTGLGLILCKEFIEKHGGTIDVQSKLNKGTTITFTVPKVVSKASL